VPPHSLTDLAGLRVSAEDFLAAVLESAAQPIWVVDPEGRIRFANPAAIAALGYGSADELFGCRSHETIHYKHPDGTAYPAAECPMLLPRTTGETVAGDLDWFFRRDGSMFPVSYVSVPIAMPDGRGAVVAFTDIEDRLGAEQALREREAMFAAREDSLRRIAALVAGGAASTDVFAAIAGEVGHVLGLPVVLVCRYDAGQTTATVIGAWGEDRHPFQAGTRWPLDGPAILAEVLKTGRPARIDDYSELPGAIADAVRKTGSRAVAGAPIIVDGDVWGAMMAGTAPGVPLPDAIEDRLAAFTELVATAISNTARRDQLARLADEQAALRRVATLVARGVPPPEVFAAVAREVGLLLGVDWTHMARYEPDAVSTGVAGWSPAGDEIPIGTRVSLDSESVRALVLRTGRPARMHYETASGQAAALGRERGLRSSVGAPIVVDQRLWGVMIAATKDDRPLPADTESRLENFTELVATAIANAEARTEVAASRARIVAATDEERRCVVRDLHDGAQQRLVHTIVTLTMAQHALQNGDEELPALLAEALENAKQATAELRELAHGILPAALTRGGLRAGVDALASRTPVPVENAVSSGRLPAAVEATAYFVVAEALTNVAKHARAGRASVAARVHDGTLQVEVRDDGVGGARPDGSGLLGLADRLAALDGQLRVESPVDGGTLVAADIPIPA
jgi:PAS domain S-box-containing protein